MGVVMTTKIENEYLLINASGSIADQKEHELFTKRIFLEIKKSSLEKIIINVSKISFPVSLEIHQDIVAFYTEELPAEMRNWKIAVVDESDYREIGYYWEFMTQKQGIQNYRVFSSIKEARTYMND